MIFYNCFHISPYEELAECSFISMHDEKSALTVLADLNLSPISLLMSTLMHKCFLDIAWELQLIKC